MQKGFTTILILVGIVFVVIIAGGAYYLGKSGGTKQSPAPVVTSQTPQPSPTSTVEEVSTWKIYNSKKYGYSFKYPTEWSSEEIIPARPDELTEQNCWEPAADIEMGVTVKKDSINSGELKGLGDNQIQISKSYSQVSGVLYRTRGTGEGGSLYRQDFIFTKNNNYYWISLSARYKGPNTTQTEESANKIFDQILSTFKFTN